MKIKLSAVCLLAMLSASCSDTEVDSEHSLELESEATAQFQETVDNSTEGHEAALDAVDDSVTPLPNTNTAAPLGLDSQTLDQNAEFELFKENFLRRTWELNPSRAVYVGYYKHDDQLLVPNGALRAQHRSFYVHELQALKSFDANRLSTGNASDLAIIEARLRSSIWYIDEFRDYEWNPAKYNPAGAFGVILNTDYKPLSERMMAISKRLEKVPAYYDAAKANIKRPTQEHLALAIQQGAGAIAMFETSIAEKLEQAELTETQNLTLLANLELATKASKSYVAWLNEQQELIEKNSHSAESKEELTRGFRIGAELYEQKFKHDIGSSYSAEELYNLALQAKKDLHSEMIRITNELWSKYFPDSEAPQDNLVAVKQLIDKLSDKHVARDQFVNEIRRQMPIIQAFMDDNDLLDSDPSRPLVVRLTPEYQRGIAGASVNAPGPYDATANTYYNVSPLDDYTDEQAESYLREYNHWILQILNIHEATPGHYTQLVHANKSPSKIKSIFANSAMIEGWAVYSERMMLEAGYGNNEPEMWLMYSKWNLRVVMNTILDYSVQVLGMERDAALDLLINQAFQQQTEAEGKWRRATLSQVQLTSYFTGYSEIYAFREELKQSMGDDFDLKEFHNTFLSYGSAPVPVIKKLMRAELSARRAAKVAIEEAAAAEAKEDSEQTSSEEDLKVDGEASDDDMQKGAEEDES